MSTENHFVVLIFLRFLAEVLKRRNIFSLCITLFYHIRNVCL